MNRSCAGTHYWRLEVHVLYLVQKQEKKKGNGTKERGEGRKNERKDGRKKGQTNERKKENKIKKEEKERENVPNNLTKCKTKQTSKNIMLVKI